MKLYPWGGKFREGDAGGCVAVASLSDDFSLPEDKVAVWGPVKTENLGVEKIVANIVSNPNIRYLILAGREVRGHMSGNALKNLHENGLDEDRRIRNSKSAIPYIENLPDIAVERFQSQVEIVDLINVTDVEQIIHAINECRRKNPGSYGEPLVVEPMEKKGVFRESATDFNLHSKIKLSEYGLIRGMD